MFYYLKKDKKRVFILSIVIIIRQLLLVYNMTINARGLNALVNFDFEEFIKQNVYLVISVSYTHLTLPTILRV